MTCKDRGIVDPGFGQAPEAFIAIGEVDTWGEFVEELGVVAVAPELLESEVHEAGVGGEKKLRHLSRPHARIAEAMFPARWGASPT